MGAGQAEGELMRGMHFRARAPLRIGLAGGGTDVDPYATEKGGVVFNTTINKFAYCTVVPTDDHAMSVHSSEYGDSRVDLGSGPLPLDGNTSLANVVANHFDIKDGFSMTLESEAPPGSGLGGSSTVIVSIISAVCKWLDKRMSGKDLAKLAYDLERKELGLKGGRQDQYAAVYGGFNIMRFKGDDVNIDLLFSLIFSPMAIASSMSVAVSSSTARRPVSMRPAALMRGPILKTMSSMEMCPSSSLERVIMASRPERGASLSCLRP